MTVSEKIIIDLYAEKVKKGDMQLTDVPERYRDRVEAIING